MSLKRGLFLGAGDGDGDDVAPPGKLLRAAAPGGDGEPPSPGRRLLRRTVLVVLFSIRARDGNAPCSIWQIRRVVREEVRRGLDPIFRVCSLMVSKLESIEERIQNLTHKDQVTPFRPNHHNQQPLMQEANQEGLATNEGVDKRTSVRLRFINGMKTHIYHDDEIKADSNAAIKIGIFDGEEMIKSGALSKVRVEILALEGDFPYDALDSWTAKEFNEHRAVGRDGKGNVLAGKCTFKLINGEASLGGIKFREGSCRARKGMFIVGARVYDGVRTGGRVQEAVMNPVVVQDRRNKANEKSHPPKLDERVHRLEEIAIGGTYCKRLEEKLICTVQDFLRALNMDSDNLAKILQINKEHKPWEKMVRHARECCLKGKDELKSYPSAERNVVLFFNCVHYLVGAEFHGCYAASEKFDPAQQVLVDKLKEQAYNELDILPFDHAMKDGFPVRISMNSNAGAGPSFLMPTASQPNYPGRHIVHPVGGIAAVEGLNQFEIHSSRTIANNDPSFSIPDQHGTHCYQNEGTRPSGQQQFSTASLTDWRQNALGQLNCSHGANEGFYLGADDDEMTLLLSQEYHINQPYCVTPGFNQVEEIQGQLFLHSNDILEASSSTYSNITLTPQQLVTFRGPAQVSVQSQREAPLPSNGPSEASTSAQNQRKLTPQQWSQCQAGMPQDRLLLTI